MTSVEYIVEVPDGRKIKHTWLFCGVKNGNIVWNKTVGEVVSVEYFKCRYCNLPLPLDWESKELKGICNECDGE